MRVPFNNLSLHHDALSAELKAAFAEVLSSGQFAGGRFVESFEQAFARYCGCDFAIGTSSGTDAIWLALRALGIGRGDEVITTPCSFFATAEAISLTGATPVFVDIDPLTCTLDPQNLQDALSEKTKAILPVHLFGQMADMDPILEFAKTHGLHVIEDAAQAHGSSYKGQKAGTIGDLGCFSFYPGKNLGALGEAGAVTTSDPKLADRVKALLNHGQTSAHQHAEIGCNARMDGIQAACLSVKLPRLDENNAIRAAVAAQYTKALAGQSALTLPASTPDQRHVYHVYAVQTEGRDQLRSRLADHGIDSRIHYPTPIHLQPAYRNKKNCRISGSLKHAERASSRFLSLPIFPEITAEQVEHICQATLQELEILNVRSSPKHQRKSKRVLR